MHTNRTSWACLAVIVVALGCGGSASSGGGTVPTGGGGAAQGQGGGAAAAAGAGTGGSAGGASDPCATAATSSCHRDTSGFGGPVCTDYLGSAPDQSKHCALVSGTYASAPCDRTNAIGGCCQADKPTTGSYSIDWVYPPTSDPMFIMNACNVTAGDHWTPP